MRKQLSKFCSVLLLAALSATAAFGADMFSGTWEASSPTEGTTTLVIAAVDNGLKLMLDGVNPSGQTSHIEFTGKFDNKAYPLRTSVDGRLVSSASDTASVRKIDDYTLELTLKRQSGVVTVVRNVVSEDGQTLTGTSTTTDGQESFKATTVYEKR